ncbi:hypothetical protein [Alkaliphilus transvaalensis]|uniref:hypothetical protein n=1 Tax=Alkaliphilus transvaalensis TaxID=114628 RepID=UPI0012EB0C8D|nr:hypothetical protein [Alkaliphilus transvaalensis]
MSLDETKTEDIIKEIEGYSFAYDKSLEDLFDEINVDYQSSWFGKGFSVSPLNSKGGNC